MKRIIKAYKDIISIIFKESKTTIILVFLFSIVLGLVPALQIYINQHIFDDGLKVARNEIPFSAYAIYLIGLIVVLLLPKILSLYLYDYAETKCQLIFRTVFRKRLITKLKTLEYYHFEDKESLEIMNKAFNRAINSVRHLYPMYIVNFISSVVGSISVLIMIFFVKWYLVILVLIPVIIETIIAFKSNFNIYRELGKFYSKELEYHLLGDQLKNRESQFDIRSYRLSDYLISTYKKRFNKRNKDYEHYFFRNLKNLLLSNNFCRIFGLINGIIILYLFLNKEISIGVFISISTVVMFSAFQELQSCFQMFRWAPMHINTFDYYDKYFNLSDEVQYDQVEITSYDIEFKDVYFKYPKSENYILKGINLKIKENEKVSLVGENGCGKTTLISLLLGLFKPTSGQILVGGVDINTVSNINRSKIFATVFQNYNKFELSLKDNIGIGDIDNIDNLDRIKEVAFLCGVEYENIDMLLGKSFHEGVDLSIGQWQRIAIARCLMGNKHILLLDEPTSSLDPMAEARLYEEFSKLADNKTTIFITHRLASTAITSKIFVISDGVVFESGSHDELMKKDGVYKKMYEVQSELYKEGNYEF